MIKFEFNKEKSIAALLYIIKQISNADLHKISKVFYYSDQKHLARYGTPITGDMYVAMKFGPVPSKIYDIIKIVRGDSIFKNDEFNKYFSINNNILIPLLEPDWDEFSESELECINESIEENTKLGFGKLTNKSHGKAYNSALPNDEILIEEIAKEGGANKEMLKYIQIISENSNILCK